MRKATPKVTQRPALWWTDFLRRITRKDDAESYVRTFTESAQLKPAVYVMGGKEVVL